MKIRSFFFFIIMTIFVKCTDTINNPIDEFCKTDSLNCTITGIKSSNIGELVDMTIIDSILVINEMFSEKIFKLFNINTGKMICNCINRGKGPNEMLYPDIITNFKRDIFSTYSQNNKRLVFISVNDLINKKYIFKRINKLEIEGSFKSYPINDSLVISTGVFEKGRYCLYNINTKNKLYKYSYPKDKKHNNESYMIKGLAYQGLITIKPDQKGFAFATGSSGNLEIYKIIKNDFKPVFRKTYFYPKYVAEGNRAARFIKENKKGFISIESTDKYIYLLYSGRSRIDSNTDAHSGNNLLVYNWTGKPIINFILDKSIKSMALFQNKHNLRIYAYSINNITGEPEIIFYTLPKH